MQKATEEREASKLMNLSELDTDTNISDYASGCDKMHE